MEYGFIDFAGCAWPNKWVDTYNRITERINQSTGETAERLKDHRHRYFQACIDVGRAGYENISRFYESWED